MNKKRIIFTLAVACCLLIAAGTSIIADATVFQYSLFDADGMYVETNVAVPDSTGIALVDRGLGISSKTDGASLTLKNTVSGEFDISFLPYSQATFGGSVIEGGSFENSYQDLDEMSLVFTDASDASKSFAVKLTGGADGNNVTVNASVVANGYRAGVYYYRDNKACGSTGGYNAVGVYTYLYGTSFSNMAVSAGSYSAANVQPVRIVFDPAEMRVYGYNYGYNAYSSEKRLIWDMSELELDGRTVASTLDGFAEYKVSVVFDSVKSGKTASAIIYSINGQSLSSSVVINGAGPVCSLSEELQSSVGGTLTLPAPNSYDVIDGKKAFAGLVKAEAPDGSSVAIKVGNDLLEPDANGYCVWEKDAQIITAQSGVYKVTYKAKDSDGLYGKEYVVSVSVGVLGDNGLQITEGYDTYVKKGTEFNVPAAKWTVGSKDIDAAVKVLAPDGSVVNAPYKASIEGRYTVVYSATVDGTALESNLYIYAFDENAELLSCSSGVSVVNGSSDLHARLSGLIATTTVANGTVTYSREIDVRSKTKNDTLVSLMALPTRIGVASMGQIAVKLTDSTDPANYVTILITPATDSDMSMVRAGSALQTPAGRSNSGAVESNLGGGTKVFHSFYGIANYVDITEQLIDVRLDYESKCVYIGSKLVCDLDDSEYFAQAWDGFGGKAILSVTLRELSAESASILINEIDGNRIYGKFYGDCVSPTIIAGFDVNDIPDAVVGKEYPVLPVEVRDNNTEADLSVVVTDRNGNALSENDAFVPYAEGDYYMTFRATDRAGNSVTARYIINAYTAVDELEISVAGELITASHVGEQISLPECVISGGSGLNVVSVTAKGKKTNTEYKADALSFTPTVVDEYVISYTVTDYLGVTATTTAGTIAVSLSEAPIWTSLPVLSEVFISGREVTLPDAAAYDYVADKAAAISVEITVNGKTIKLGADRKYLPQSDLAETPVTINYIATAASGKTATLSYNATLISLYDSNGLVIKRYFKTVGMDKVEQTEDYILFEFSKGGNSIELVKSIYSHGFELTFDVPASANNFNAVTLELIDSVDPSKKVIFTATKGGFADKTTTVSVNGLQTLSIEGSFFEAVKRMRIAYDNDDYSIKDSSGLTVGYVKYYSDGTRFAGFSDEIKVRLSADGVEGLGQLQLYKIGNQLLMENDGDYTSPVIVTESEIQRSVNKGEQLVISKAKAFDVLGFDTTVTVSVSKGASFLLRDVSASEEHTLTLDEYGEYNVIYSALDDNGNVARYSMVVNVRDNVAPTINVNDVEIVVRVGSKVELPSASVSDDVGVDKQFVFVIDTYNNMINVTGSTSYTPALKGIYTIRYVAVDAAGNYAIKDVVLKVAEA